MHFPDLKQTLSFLLAALAAVVAWRWGVPVALPFLLGLLVALAAEPLVGFFCRRLPRGAASALGVSLTLLALLSLLILLTAVLLRQLTGLADRVPELVGTMRGTLSAVQTSLQTLTHKAPKELQPMLRRTTESLLSSGGTLLDTLVQQLPAAATAVLGYLTDSFLAVGTGCLAAFMFSARLPQLQQKLHCFLDRPPLKNWLPRLQAIRHALWGWLKAQGALCGICFCILLVGFWLLGIRNALLWAAVIALVDAVPLLGTGTVLIPWALVRLLQGDAMFALGLLAIYAAAFLSRSALEPRFLGKQLGLDPLLTLVSLYAGYRFWGFGGMLLSPIICVVLKEAAKGQDYSQ